MIIVATWTVDIIVMITYFTTFEVRIHNYSGNEIWTQTLSYFQKLLRVVSALIVVADFVFIFGYSMIVYTVKKNLTLRSSQSGRQDKHQSRIRAMCILITASFVLTTAPFAFFKLGLISTLTQQEDRQTANHWTRLLVVSNGLFNSLIYLVQNYWKVLPCTRNRRAVQHKQHVEGNVNDGMNSHSKEDSKI